MISKKKKEKPGQSMSHRQEPRPSPPLKSNKRKTACQSFKRETRHRVMGSGGKARRD